MRWTCGDCDHENVGMGGTFPTRCRQCGCGWLKNKVLIKNNDDEEMSTCHQMYRGLVVSVSARDSLSAAAPELDTDTMIDVEITHFNGMSLPDGVEVMYRLDNVGGFEAGDDVEVFMRLAYKCPQEKLTKP